jgi:hypothetical protein
MRSGYLLLETSASHPGLVRIFITATLPPLPGPAADPELRHAVRFDDIDVARMHAHELLCRRLVDIDAGLYRAGPLEAVAAVESIGLSHRRVYLDPALAADPALEPAIATLIARRQRRDRIWEWVGMAALGLLLIKVLLGF